MFCAQVLRALLDALPRQPAVAAFMIDFEAALWRAVAKEFPDTTGVIRLVTI